MLPKLKDELDELFLDAIFIGFIIIACIGIYAIIKI